MTLIQCSGEIKGGKGRCLRTKDILNPPDIWLCQAHMPEGDIGKRYYGKSGSVEIHLDDFATDGYTSTHTIGPAQS